MEATTFVTMTQRHQNPNGLGEIMKTVQVPVYNSWSKAALMLNPEDYGWAADLNYDLAAHWAKDPRVTQWLDGFDPDLHISKLVVASMFVAPNPAKTILFADVFQFTAKEPDRKKFALWCGNTSALALLFRDENGKLYALLTREERAAVGKARAAQFPAGIIEPNGAFKIRAESAIETALRELKEETGVDATGQIAQYIGALDLSQGRLVERTFIYLLIKEALSDDILKYQKKQAGLVAQGENIVLELVDLEDVDSTDAAGHSPIAIFVKGVMDQSIRRQARKG